jgi:hypothetical protein
MMTTIRDFVKQSLLLEFGSGKINRVSKITTSAEREYWIRILTRIVSPVLENLSAKTLKTKMPVETSPGAKLRKKFAHLEAFGRSLAGLAPWLELGVDGTKEGKLRAKFIDLSCSAIRNAVNPASPDYLNFSDGQQPLVDVAFFAQALVRAPKQLWSNLDEATKQHVVTALKSTRAIAPHYNNWLLFPAMIEAALLKFDKDADLERIHYAVTEHEKWYLGDGFYSDGPTFRLDYYNSFVIQPMLIDILQTVYTQRGEMGEMLQVIFERAERYAVIQERLIAPDGSFPPVGRSLSYRCGAFQLLAQLALYNRLPDALPTNQVRSALNAVISRTMEVRGTFDWRGWLQIGLAGYQPELAEDYISTGSLYLCSTAFLPLGLPAENIFWTTPPCNWTSKKAFEGSGIEPDKAFDAR